MKLKNKPKILSVAIPGKGHSFLSDVKDWSFSSVGCERESDGG